MRWILPLLVWAVCGVRSAAGELRVRIQPRWGNESLGVPGEFHVLRETRLARGREGGGVALRVTRLAAILSDASLLARDGRVVRLEGQFGFIDAESGRLEWTLSGVPEGDYAGITFAIGVAPDINRSAPGRWPAGHALNPLTNKLHWSWQGGYVFLALEGKWRDASAPAEAPERGFSYHLATNERRMAVRFEAFFQVKKATRIDLALDVAKVLAVPGLGRDEADESTHSAAGDELAPRLASAVERAWFWLSAEEISRAPADVETPGPVPAAAAGATPLAFVVPAGFPQPALPRDNPLTAEGVALGKALFHDRRLSRHGAQSCATCHSPERAFSDDVALSRGADGARGRRNAMPLFNLAWSPAYAWDGSQKRIRDQALAAMTNPIEMHADGATVVAALGADAEMGRWFAAAFGSSEVTAERLSLALEQYLLTLVSADSKFDRAMRGEAALSADESRGLELFAAEYDPARGRRGADCFHCHGGAMFTDFEYRDNGIAASASDPGRERVTQQAGDRGKFKTPSLRNVALTAPYMHDGRFATLEEVVAHYDHGVQRRATLDPNLAKHPLAGMELSAGDQRALVAFLKTLTDPRRPDGG